MPIFQYDPEVKMLSIRLGKAKSVDSDIKGKVILDYDKNGHLVNLDIMEVNLEDFLKSMPKNKRKVSAVKK